MRNSKSGISMIVLIATIAVMIILATAIILTVSGSGVIENANITIQDTDVSSMRDAAGAAYATYESEVALGKIDEENVEIEDYIKDKLREQGYTDKQLKLLEITDDGEILVYKYPVIPEGFVVSDIETEDDVVEGLVIYEGIGKVSTDTDARTTRNQFVWVPVPNISAFVRKDGYNNGTKQTYVSSGDATEPFSKTYNGVTLSETNDLTGEYAEYAKMKASVEKYGGFYIARYEAGTTNARTSSGGTSFKADGITPDVLSQKNKNPYNYVGWGPNMTTITGNISNSGLGAVELSRGMYPESANKKVVSTLIYGVQWDAVMNFMKNIQNPNVQGKTYIEDSTGMGWYSNNYNNATTGNQSHKTGIDVGTNASNMVKNIYDMAGNLFEWTMEAYSTGFRVICGGYYSTAGSDYPLSSRVSNRPNITTNADYGFRFALYLR